MTGPDLPSVADTRTIAAVLAARFGGSAAVRDPAALAEALRWPLLRRHADAASVAASLLEGLERHRPFAQGNHRVGFALADVCLRLHGWRLAALPERLAGDLVRMLRAGQFEHAALAAWLRGQVVRDGAA